MDRYDKVSTGHVGFDQAIEHLRLGDNVVWQVDSMDSYKKMVYHFVDQAKSDQRRLVYFRFGNHEALYHESSGLTVHPIDASKGFESFATQIHTI